MPFSKLSSCVKIGMMFRFFRLNRHAPVRRRNILRGGVVMSSSSPVTFWSLLQESVIVQSVITLLLVGVICYLSLVGREVPPTLSSALQVILGFWLGSKSALSASKVREYLQRPHA